MTINPISVIVILILGVLFFGKNLPAVIRQIGTYLTEFRKGVDEWKELSDVKRTATGRSVHTAPDDSEEQFESLGTKFEPP